MKNLERLKKLIDRVVEVEYIFGDYEEYENNFGMLMATVNALSKFEGFQEMREDMKAVAEGKRDDSVLEKWLKEFSRFAAEKYGVELED